jgi:hypothetical protein
MRTLPGAIGERRGFLGKDQFGAGWHHLCDESPVLAIGAHAHGGIGSRWEGCERNNGHLGGVFAAAEHKAYEVEIGSAYVGRVINGDGVWAAPWIGGPHKPPAAG